MPAHQVSRRIKRSTGLMIDLNRVVSNHSWNSVINVGAVRSAESRSRLIPKGKLLMNRTKLLVIAVLTMMLGACSSVPQKPIAFDAGAIVGGANRVAIQLNKMPATDTSFPGAGCLLCIGVARTMHSALSTQVQSLQPEELNALPERLAEVLRRDGAQVVVLEQPLDIGSLPDNGEKGENQSLASKDFRSLADKVEADKLLVLNIRGQGVLRPYSSYIPAGIPRAYVSGIAYMVDLKTNTYLWYSSIDTSRPAEGEWDEPPSFPGLTNAYYQVLAETSDSLVSELSSKAASTSVGDSGTETTAKVTQ